MNAMSKDGYFPLQKYDADHKLVDVFTLPQVERDNLARLQNAAERQGRRDGRDLAEWAAENLKAKTPEGKAAASPASGKLILARDMSPRLMVGGTLIRGLLDEGAMSVIYAPSNVGKSFLALDIAFHVAMNRPWRGLKIQKPGPVLYLAAEGGHGFVNRVIAIKREHGQADNANVPLAVLPCPVDLLDPLADRDLVVGLIDMVSKEFGQPVSLVVFDTLNRLMVGGDENSARDMGAFVQNVDHIRAARQAHCCIIHHTGKDVTKGARGHSSLRAAADSEIELARTGEGEDKTFSVAIRKQREMAGDDVFLCSLRAVVLGQNEDGEDVTSAVVEHLNAPDPGAADTRRIKGMPALRLEKLCGVINAMGRVVRGQGIPPGTRAVLLEEWRTALIDGGLIDGPTPDAQRMQFNRTREALLKQRAIGVWKEHVWPVWGDD